MFGQLEMAPPDPILGLTEAFGKDSNANKINLSVGVYKSEDGVTPVLDCVKQAERRLVEDESTKSYLPISGSQGFTQLVIDLLLGADHPITQAGRAAAVQTPGGTGAVRVAADFIRQRLPGKRVWCSDPTWANHPNIFAAAGLETEKYTYLNAARDDLDYEGMMRDLAEIPHGDVLLLHGCCHNPSGIDPTVEQWAEISKTVVERGLLPLVDFAYQGFGSGLEEDAAGVRKLCEGVPELLIATSYSKNFGLYRERVGALTVIGEDSQAATTALSNIKSAVRANYSNPPAHGAELVRIVLSDNALRTQWEQELAEMRDRINGMRELFVSTMREFAPDRDFSFITRQRGMFSFSGLSPDQVQRLRDENSIYIVGSGRINVAGITTSNVRGLCESIAAVL